MIFFQRGKYVRELQPFIQWHFRNISYRVARISPTKGNIFCIYYSNSYTELSAKATKRKVTRELFVRVSLAYSSPVLLGIITPHATFSHVSNMFDARD